MIAAMTNVWRRLPLVFALGALLSTGAAGQREISPSPPLPPTSTSIVVKLRDAADAGALRTAPGVQAVDAFLPDAWAIGRRSAARHAGRDARGPDGADADAMALEAGFARTFIVRVTDAAAVAATLARFRQDSAVEYAERNAPMAAQWIPNDPYFASSGSWGQPHADLYGLHLIHAADAWDVSRGAGIVVAVVDSGLDRSHVDIDAKVWVNPGEIPGNGSDDDGNGYIDDVHGWDFAYGDADPHDRNGHGTHVAGIVAAEGNNAEGIVGTAPEARVMPVQVMNDFGAGTYAVGAAGIVYAVMNGADVVNASWVGESPSQLLEETVRYAYARGVLVVVCAGNAGLDAADFMPASIPEAVTVAASDHLDHLWPSSNRGIGVDVTAPGDGILSLRAFGIDPYGGGTHIVGERYYWASGTSMAAGYVSGAVAAILSRFPAEKIGVTRDRLAFTADPIEVGNGELVGSLGGGRLNLARALTEPLARASLSISGRVVDRQGSPMAGVTVGLGVMASQRVVTSGDGRFRFVNLRPGGHYAARVSQLGAEFLPWQIYYWELLTSPTEQNIVGVRRWAHDPIDTTWAAGFGGLSQALDGAGQPRVAYHLPFEHQLRYAALTSQGWAIEVVDTATSGVVDVGGSSTLALDAAGRPHIVYARYSSAGTPAICYARRDASAWILEDVPGVHTIGQPRFVLDSAGRPHIVDIGPNPTAFLRHWWKDASGWHDEHVIGAPFMALSDLAIDSQDRLHVAYQVTAGGGEIGAGFWQGVRDPSGWHHVLIDPERFSGVPASFAFAGGQPRLAYGYWQAYGANPSLLYANWNGASWQTMPIQPGLHPFGVSLAEGVAGGSLAVYDSGPGGLTAALGLGGGWGLQLVRRGLAGAFTDLTRDAQGGAHLVYTDRHTGFAWHARTLQLIDPAWAPPAVAVAAPIDGSTIGGTVAVRVNAQSPVGITRVDVWLDGDTLLATLSAAPYVFEWNTNGVSHGVHSITARATDVTATVATHAISVTVMNRSQ